MSYYFSMVDRDLWLQHPGYMQTKAFHCNAVHGTNKSTFLDANLLLMSKLMIMYACSSWRTSKWMLVAFTNLHLLTLKNLQPSQTLYYSKHCFRHLQSVKIPKSDKIYVSLHQIAESKKHKLLVRGVRIKKSFIFSIQLLQFFTHTS